jgi:hypothetical protein
LQVKDLTEFVVKIAVRERFDHPQQRDNAGRR